MENLSASRLYELRKYLPAVTRSAPILLLSLLMLPISTPAAPFQTLPPLGTAAKYGVLGASTVTNTGATVITGRLGVSPGTAVTGFPPGTVSGSTCKGVSSHAGPAQADAAVAYVDAAGDACTDDLT